MEARARLEKWKRVAAINYIQNIYIEKKEVEAILEFKAILEFNT